MANRPKSPAAIPVFAPAALKFLRSLARNNDREWFAERRETYERELRVPMLALVERVNALLAEVAPDHVRLPHKAMLRIHRDTRFSKDKRPLKTHVAVWWGLPGMERTTGPGFYLDVGAKHATVGAGIFMPTPEHLLALRRWLAEEHVVYRKLVVRAVKDGPLVETDTQPLTRVPRGFAADSPAAELLKARRLGVVAELPAETALEPGFEALLMRCIRQAAPLVMALDEAVRPKRAEL